MFGLLQSEYTLYLNEVVLCDDKYLEVKKIDYEECLRSYNTQKDRWLRSVVDATTISQVLEWLRNEKNIFVVVFIDDDSDYPVTYNIFRGTDFVYHHHGNYFTLSEWSECEMAGIEYVIDNLI